jgi:hypothetical protein
MNRIEWVGQPDRKHWPVVPQTGSPFRLSLCDDQVLALARSPTGCHLDWRAALACINRLAQRVALAGSGLNPEWAPAPMPCQRVVAKHATSTLSGGVGQLHPDSDLAYSLIKHAGELADWGVIEQEIGGAQYEQDGCILDGEIGWFWPIQQHWDRLGHRIERYERLPWELGQPLRRAAERALRAVGLNQSCFSVEIRFHDSDPDQARVIDLHARLGEDGESFRQAISDRYPLEVVEEIARKLRPD